jgi:cadmium resistance protein CadD (predicted permease)
MVSSSAVTLALLSFFSTTVDDFCVILIFFAREYVKTHSLRDTDTIKSFIKISVGQTLGFTFILIVSLCLGIGLHSVVNNDYVDLIGLLPVCIGLYKVYELFAESIQNCTCCKVCLSLFRMFHFSLLYLIRLLNSNN